EVEAKGRAEGKAEGEAKGIIELGIEFGLSENDILARLQNKLNVSLQAAQEYMGMFRKMTV
ncbi:MAG: transposase, partial [Acetatifactor sp.]|nr:transposase [Acetatifactor sp.]